MEFSSETLIFIQKLIYENLQLKKVLDDKQRLQQNLGEAETLIEELYKRNSSLQFQVQGLRSTTSKAPRNVCWYHLYSRCRFGNRCRYEHINVQHPAQSWSRKSTDDESRKAWKTVRGTTDYSKTTKVIKAASLPDTTVFKLLKNTEGKFLRESDESITQVEQRQQDETSSIKHEKASIKTRCDAIQPAAANKSQRKHWDKPVTADVPRNRKIKKSKSVSNRGINESESLLENSQGKTVQTETVKVEVFDNGEKSVKYDPEKNQNF